MKELNFEAFITEIQERLYKRMGEEVRIDIHETVKNNDVTYKGISVLKKGCNISPNLRLEDFFEFYQRGQDLETVLEKMIKIFEDHPGKTMDMECFTDFEKAKDRILFKLVDYEENRERLKSLPHKRFLDFAIIYFYYLEEGCVAGGTASIQIEAEHLEHWQIDESSLHRLAIGNTRRLFPPKFYTMENIISKMMEEKGIDPESYREEMKDMQRQLPMYVLTNFKNYFGASVLYYPNVLKKISNKFGTDLLILPSSVHEVIVLPAEGNESFEEMNIMIRDINENQVAAEEVLSNHLYYYDKKKEKLLIPSVTL